MSIKNFLLQHNCIQLGVVCKTWEDAIYCAAQPLIDAKFITEEYPIAVIKNTKEYGPYYVFDEGIAIPHARPECGVRGNCFSLLTLQTPISIQGSEPVDILIMFGGVSSDAHITEGIASIVNLLEKDDMISRIRTAITSDDIAGVL
ncbi:PTS sugar transporter subunit IIA [Pectobacterium aroidearum]|uniref:PTS sugar transporter subunit IIA n=1 Tax=Pectobacterium aroidearum TaxID=1201031 RepID=UPI0015EFF372|nr:PTS sugar transporter subunit IIA [Pectobacterium aroidearum]MBA5235314.1 PTS sugar transporter subunit IIA [Pectobacterium aroidearum]UUE43174.1 PTS sugar transporter subunit IIA [Pectobacterium aroidearum]UUE47390.1 PTS sugar transporter subunit IIA [Pectobacterium aroidearum]UUE51597.1 PTS sugar transporter subunit IIA [Pectobacterium aroidearum]UUE60008.1 PTS sugar transporter subunit IIA [Pectobacterium aroidearum]